MTKRSPALGGIGSNQYQAKPSSSRSSQPRNEADVSADDVAWAFTPEREQWARRGVNTRREMLAWAATGIPEDDIHAWVDCEFSPEDAQRWFDNGWGREEGMGIDGAHHWRDCGFHDPVDVVPWRSVEISYIAAEAHRTAGDTPVEAVQKWEAAQFNEVSRWGWSADGYTLEDAIKWRDAGVKMNSASTWRAWGYGPEEAGPWCQAGISDPGTFQRLRDAGMDPDDVRPWIASGFAPVDWKWFVSGHSIEDAQRRKANGENP